MSANLLKITVIVIIAGLTVLSCEESDSTPPEVTIVTPSTGSSVSEVVNVTCIASDNKGVEKVELWVDAVKTAIVDNTEPYSLPWNTTQYQDGSNHAITIRAYDTNDNVGDSDPVNILIDQSDSYPSAVDVISVNYDTTAMTVTWVESQSSDFEQYELFESNDSINFSLLEIITDQSTTSYVLSIFNPLKFNYFRVTVMDSFGLRSSGSALSNIIDSPPDSPILYPIEINGDVVDISWTADNSTDFSSFTLNESSSESMSNPTTIYSTTNGSNARYQFSKPELNSTLYYQVIARDYWEQLASSNIEDGYFSSGFSKLFDGYSTETGHSLQQTTDLGYIIAGFTWSYGHGGRDVWLVRTDEDGNHLWDKTYGSSDDEYGYSVQETSDGGFIVGGRKEQEGHSFYYLVKTDEYGTLEWEQTYGGEWPDDDVCSSVKQTNDGGFILCGTSESQDASSYSSIWIIKTDGNGIQEWDAVLDGEDYESAADIQLTEDGGYIVAGNASYSDTYTTQDRDIWLIKLATDGSVQWTRTLGTSQSERAKSIAVTSDQGFIITGSGFGGLALLKTDSEGNEEWNQGFITPGGWNVGNSVKQTLDGGFIITGRARPEDGGSFYLYLIRTDEAGNELWSHTFGGEEDDEGFDVIQTSDGGFAITGETWSFEGDYSKMWLIKTNPDGYY